jgi:hypothetical protein
MRMLTLMAASPKGESEVPWGTSDAGRYASAWYRTADSLVDKGLAIRPYTSAYSDVPGSGRGTIQITQSGREALMGKP